MCYPDPAAAQLVQLRDGSIMIPTHRGVIWGAGGNAPHKEKEKNKKEGKKQKREGKEKKRRKKGTTNNVKLLHIKSLFFQSIFNIQVELKNK